MTTLNDATVRHLLVVDDDDRIRTLLKEFLSRHGFRVTNAVETWCQLATVLSLESSSTSTAAST